jgi:hypothetical protein
VARIRDYFTDGVKMNASDLSALLRLAGWRMEALDAFHG